MLAAYRQLCAYSALYIESGTGRPTIDHIVPKSQAWDRVYEWSNYRLACSLVNSLKGVHASVLDPFAIEDDWFALEFVAFQVMPGARASGATRAQVETTIERLGLNRPDFCRQREE